MRFNILLRYCVRLVFGIMAVVLVLSLPSPGRAAAIRVAFTVPSMLGGGTGKGDQRDADVYTSVAFASESNRYLVVWMSARNASSGSAGLDVFGRFLDANGVPTGDEFRISDGNSAARSSPPIVVSGSDGFLVAWTNRGSKCNIVVQEVSSDAAVKDQILVSTAQHNHSPSLIYNAERNQYVLAFVTGDNYQAPTLFGANTEDCGNNPNSTSVIRALTFHSNKSAITIDSETTVSDIPAGAFRPALDHHPALANYLVTWEDRRGAGGQLNRFSVRSRLLGEDLKPTSTDLALTRTLDYTNDDMSSTWTPRPIVVASDSQFLTAWFERRVSGYAATWFVQGVLVNKDASVTSFLTLSEITFANEHPGQAPTGFLAANFDTGSGEFVLGLNTHLETIRGYQAVGRLQRVDANGTLLSKSGDVLTHAGIGEIFDVTSDEQFTIAIANHSELIVYSKHAPGQHSLDFDVWAVRMERPAAKVFLPLLRR